MKIIRYTIETKAPIIISESGGISFFSYTKTYIPGSIIRGMFASRYIIENELTSLNAYRNSYFKDFFLSDFVSFSNAYIATPSASSHSAIENRPLPLSLHKNKKDDSQIIDLLLKTREERKISQTKAIQGYGRFEDNNLFIQDVNKYLFFHHKRNKTSGAPETGMFFNYECLAPGQYFIGDIRFIDDNIATNFYNQFQNDSEFHIGRSRNSQYGLISIKLNSPEDWTQNNKDCPDNIILTFLSDAILIDEEGRYCTDENSIENYFNAILNSSSAHICIEKAYLRIKEIENFVAVWKLRRPTDIAIKAGSCFLIIFNGNDDALKKLNSFSFLGIGERRSEGFGRFVINWQHKIQKKTTNSKDTVELSGSAFPIEDSLNGLNSYSKNIIAEIITNQLFKKISNIAHDDVDKKILADDLKKASKSSLARLEKAALQFDSLDQFKNGFLAELTRSYKTKLEEIKIDMPPKKNIFEYLNNLNLSELINRVGMDNGLTSIIDKNKLGKLEIIYLRHFTSALRNKHKAVTANNRGTG